MVVERFNPDEKPAIPGFIRPATMADAEQILRWRNDRWTRLFRDDDAPVSADQHCNWMTRRICADQIYVYEYSGAILGNLVLDFSDEGTEVGWIVAPGSRQMGIGARMTRLMLPRIKSPWAKMRPDNVASVRVAIAAGMKYWGCFMPENGRLKLKFRGG